MCSSLCLLSSGFLIYFGYGIRNSSEAVAGRKDAYVPACSMNGQPVAPEKEAFLHDTHSPIRDEDDDDDDDEGES